MLTELELENFYRMLRAKGTRENIELALQIAESNGFIIEEKLYDQLIEISRDIDNAKLPDIFELKENGTLVDKIEFVNAANSLTLSSVAQLLLLRYSKHFNEIQKIQCWGLGLREIPEDIFRFQRIEKLNIGNNRIVKLPQNLTKLRQIKEINLFANQLTQFPEVLGQMPTLIDLQLGANQITSLPEDIGKLKNLIYLGLTDNEISKLPDSFFTLKNLQVLSLTGNPIEPQQIADFRVAIPGCKLYV